MIEKLNVPHKRISPLRGASFVRVPAQSTESRTMDDPAVAERSHDGAPAVDSEAAAAPMATLPTSRQARQTSPSASADVATSTPKNDAVEWEVTAKDLTDDVSKIKERALSLGLEVSGGLEDPTSRSVAYRVLFQRQKRYAGQNKFVCRVKGCQRAPQSKTDFPQTQNVLKHLQQHHGLSKDGINTDAVEKWFEENPAKDVLRAANALATGTTWWGGGKSTKRRKTNEQSKTKGAGTKGPGDSGISGM